MMQSICNTDNGQQISVFLIQCSSLWCQRSLRGLSRFSRLNCIGLFRQILYAENSRVISGTNEVTVLCSVHARNVYASGMKLQCRGCILLLLFHYRSTVLP